MKDLVEAVRAEHHRVLELGEEILARCGEGPVGERRARRVIDALVSLESRHEAAEAICLWPVVRDVLPEYAELRETAKSQERLARVHLHRLHKLAGREGSTPLATLVVREVVAHVGLEESQVLPSLAAALSPDDSMRIGRIYERVSAAGPSRPHPRVPAVPGLLSMMAPMAARVDRVRDLLRLR